MIAFTRLKIGISTEVGCRNCHGGPWGQQGRTGLPRQTAAAILAIHDKRSNTRLGDDFDRGRLVICRNCHADNSRDAAGQAERLNLSAAMHGFHAAHIDQENDSCSFCHAGSDHGPQAAWRICTGPWAWNAPAATAPWLTTPSACSSTREEDTVDHAA